jgi:hypothetical protein
LIISILIDLTLIKDSLLIITAVDRFDFMIFSLFKLLTSSPPLLGLNEAPRMILSPSCFGGCTIMNAAFELPTTETLSS